MKLTTLITSPPALLLQTLVGSTALFYLQEASLEAVKWTIPSIAVILADLKFGTDAARFRGEKVRFSSARRRTGNKILAYGCWIFVAVSLKQSFDMDWIAWVVMAVVMINELISCFNNYLEPRGKRLSEKGFWRFIGKKTGNEGLGDLLEDVNDEKHENSRNDS